MILTSIRAVKRSLSRLYVTIILHFSSNAIGGYMIIEDYTLLETFYQTVITISTVGFEEKEPFSDAGMIFTAIYIIFNLGIFAFAISSLTSYLFEGELNKVFNVYLTARELKNMENHVLFAVLDETEGRLLRS